MALFFPPKKPAASTPAASARPNPSRGNADRLKRGEITRREMDRDVMGRLRRSGMSERDRNIVESVTSGYLDANGFRSTGMNFREKEELMRELREKKGKLGLEKKDIDRVDDALSSSL